MVFNAGRGMVLEVDENLDKEAVSHMGGVIHCDTGCDRQQHLFVKDFQM